jgi:hypothetical protein
VRIYTNADRSAIQSNQLEVRIYTDAEQSAIQSNRLHARSNTDVGSSAIQSNQSEVRINTDAERSAIESNHEVYIIGRVFAVVAKQDSIDCSQLLTFSQKGTRTGLFLCYCRSSSSYCSKLWLVDVPKWGCKYGLLW